MTATPIELHGLSKTYRLGFLMNRKVRALDGLDMVIQPGQVFLTRAVGDEQFHRFGS